MATLLHVRQEETDDAEGRYGVDVHDLEETLIGNCVNVVSLIPNARIIDEDAWVDALSKIKGSD